MEWRFSHYENQVGFFFSNHVFLFLSMELSCKEQLYEGKLKGIKGQEVGSEMVIRCERSLF